jgi:hypothetical protein
LGFVNPTHNRTLKPIDFSKFYQLQSAFGNFGGSLYLDGKPFPYSYLELSKPTGKYVDRTILKAINLLSTKGFIHYAGNACSPGLQFPEISNSGHVAIDDANKCGVQIINVQGMPTISNAVTIPAEPFMNLEIRESWKTFEDYISNMSSKYRVRTNKVLKTTENYIVQPLSIEQANEWIPQCAQLLGHTLKDKTLAISPNAPATPSITGFSALKLVSPLATPEANPAMPRDSDTPALSSATAVFTPAFLILSPVVKASTPKTFNCSAVRSAPLRSCSNMFCICCSSAMVCFNWAGK